MTKVKILPSQDAVLLERNINLFLEEIAKGNTLLVDIKLLNSVQSNNYEEGRIKAVAEIELFTALIIYKDKKIHKFDSRNISREPFKIIKPTEPDYNPMDDKEDKIF